MWKRTIKIVLSAAIFSSSLAHAQVDSMVAALPNDAGKSNGNVVISFIPAENQREYMENLVLALKANQNSAVLIATTGPEDSMAQTPEYRQLVKMEQADSVIASTIDDLPVTPKSKKYKEYVKDYIKNRPPLGLKEKKAAVAVSFVPAVGYGTLVFLMSGDYMMATASFGLVMSVNAFQAVFSDQWNSFIGLGEKGAKTVMGGLAKLTGKQPNTRTRALAAAAGKIGMSVAFNTGVAALNMAMAGELNSAWALLAFGFASTYDLWDQVLEKRIQNSPFFKKYFVNSRVAVGSVLECFALAGFGVAGLFLVGAAASSAVGMLFQAGRSDQAAASALFASARAERGLPALLTWKQKIGVAADRWSERFSRWGDKMERFYQSETCASMLMAAGPR